MTRGLRIFKRTQEPNFIRRQEILKDLVFLKQNPSPKNSEIIASLRRELRTTFSRTYYYLFYKGLEYYLGDNTTQNKFIFQFDVLKDLSIFREQNKKSKTELKYYSSLDMSLHKINGFLAPGEIKQVSKTLKKRSVFVFKKPADFTEHIGLELEFASQLDRDDLAEWIVERGLQKNVRIMTDSSIETDSEYPYQIELCFICKWHEFDSIFERLRPLLESGIFDANESCGLHVHLDARHNVEKIRKMYYNLVCMQSLLFELAAPWRRENNYCRPVNTPLFDEVNGHTAQAHYHAISKFSVYKHQTIEVRIHESTKDIDKIKNWVKLLKNIADYSGTDLSFSGLEMAKTKVYDMIIGEDLKQYVQKNVS